MSNVMNHKNDFKILKLNISWNSAWKKCLR